MIYLLAFIILFCTYQIIGFGVEVNLANNMESSIQGYTSDMGFCLFGFYTHHLTFGIILVGIAIGFGFRWK